MKKKIIIIIIIMLTILFFAIGFAAVSTTLIINGTTLIGTNQNDFYVYFSEAVIDSKDLSDEVISEDKQSINYKVNNLTLKGDTSILEYEVVNASRNYDADIKVICKGESDEVLVTQTPENQIVLAGTTNAGTVTVTLNKNIVEEKEIPFTCTLTVSAVERTELGEAYRACEYEIGTVWNFGYKGTEQEFVTPCDGTYKVELWGAQGGNTTMTGWTGTGGKGAYVSGDILLTEEKQLFLHIGGKGNNGLNSRGAVLIAGGYNGGGSNGTKDAASAAGGGATDIRLQSGNWNNFDSLKSRIMVAGAGGGSGILNVGAYGNAGAVSSVMGSLYGYNGTQTSGGIAGVGYTHNSMATAGGFGYAGNGGYYITGGGGSGYYGGGGGNHITTSRSGGGGGGSSYISGHEGCNAITAESTASNITHTGQSIHYSGIYFTNTKMLNGNETIPTYDGTSTMTGNTGNGYAKITLVSID